MATVRISSRGESLAQSARLSPRTPYSSAALVTKLHLKPPSDDERSSANLRYQAAVARPLKQLPKASPEKTCLETDAEVHSKPDRRLALALRILLESDGDNGFNEVRHRTGGERTVQKRCEAPRRFPGVEGHPHSCAKRVRQRVDDAWMDGV